MAVLPGLTLSSTQSPKVKIMKIILMLMLMHFVSPITAVADQKPYLGTKRSNTRMIVMISASKGR